MSSISRRKFLGAGLGASAALGLAGCGRGYASGVVTPREDTVNILSKDTQLVRNFNVFSPSNHAGPSNGLIFEQIVRLDTFDGASIKPWLASSWEFADGGRELIFTVRDGLTFSDGRPVTADDFAYSMQLPLKYPELNSSGAGYSGVTKINDRQVKLIFEEPSYQNLVNCTEIVVVPRHQWEKHDPRTWTAPDPIGTGPSLLAGFSSQQFLFKSRKNYWAGPLPMPYVRFPTASEDSAKLLMVDGQLDLSTIAWPGGTKHYVDRDPSSYSYAPRPSGGSEGIVFNLTKAPWNDVHVRRALSMTIDRKVVSDVLADGQQPMTITNLDDDIYRDWLLPEYAGKVQPLDVDGARRELAAGGWKIKNGRLSKDGKSYPVNFRFITDYPAWHIETAVVADQWQRYLGLDVNLIAQPGATYNGKVNSGDFDVAYWFCGNANGVYQAYYSLIDPSLAVPIGKVAVGNPGRWKDPETKRLMAIMRGTDDEAVLHKVGRRMQRIVVEQVPFIPVLSGGIWNAINKTYWGNWPISDNAPLKVADSTADLVLMLQKLRKVGQA
ncbi:ABC transporter substrate-binding protein [Microlunatus soli]|uniref:Peptide/nickel transport system substrate-binding protein n=1 Tax=Microlunatus soli TaxID=630515 RepID=A0A1H1W1C3_9ACTN|nr:ABC transporter substrate-binding protein [Microlunatus soli]SDS90501.1 peptide/nickel transport system substrate-binding protein [Microlunatus soli]